MRPSPLHSQSKCESSQNSSQGCYFENIVSREVFEKRKFFFLWICLRARMDSRNRSFSRILFYSSNLPFVLLVSDLTRPDKFKTARAGQWNAAPLFFIIN